MNRPPIDPFEDQARFMRLARQTVGKFDYEQYLRYRDHIVEETMELSMAVETYKILDSLTDLLVVTIGALHSLGVPPQECWLAVHRSNMAKVDGSHGPIVYRSDGQIGKPEDWVNPELALKAIAVKAGLLNDDLKENAE